MTKIEWFNPSHLKLNKNIVINDLHGYVLPHAGTKYTGHILSHTLRFRPKKHFTQINIIYYPAHDKENVVDDDGQEYYHEYYVVWKTLEHVINNYWKLHNAHKIKFNGINIRNNPLNNTGELSSNITNTLTVVSADFSHFKELHQSLEYENCASNSLMHRTLNLYCNNVVDNIKSFEMLFKIMPNTHMLQWVGRTRSPGRKGVGYLSFLIRSINPLKTLKMSDGLFVTAYDSNMVSRECLGEWFKKTHTKNEKIIIEDDLINKVIHLAKTTSRLTGGKNLRPHDEYYYTITYLYKDTLNTHNKNFIRGWHGIKHNAFYLPTVMLETTFNNGTWITAHDHVWKPGNKFNMKHTLKNLSRKANLTKRANKEHPVSSKLPIFYKTAVFHSKYIDI